MTDYVHVVGAATPIWLEVAPHHHCAKGFLEFLQLGNSGIPNWSHWCLFFKDAVTC